MSEYVAVSTLSPEPVQMERVTTYEQKPAGFWIRFWAYLLDLLVISAITGIIVKPLFRIIGLEDVSITWFAPLGLVSGLVFYLYFVIMTKIWAQTIGKMVLGIKVVSDSGKPLTWGTVLFREWIGRFLSVKIVILYLVAAFTPQKKAIHDYIADTRVIHENSFEKQERLLVAGNNKIEKESEQGEKNSELHHEGHQSEPS